MHKGTHDDYLRISSEINHLRLEDYTNKTNYNEEKINMLKKEFKLLFNEEHNELFNYGMIDIYK